MDAALRWEMWCDSTDKAKISLKQKCLFRQLLSTSLKMCSKTFWSVIFFTNHSKADWSLVSHIVF